MAPLLGCIQKLKVASQRHRRSTEKILPTWVAIEKLCVSDEGNKQLPVIKYISAIAAHDMFARRLKQSLEQITRVLTEKVLQSSQDTTRLNTLETAISWLLGSDIETIFADVRKLIRKKWLSELENRGFPSRYKDMTLTLKLCTSTGSTQEYVSLLKELLKEVDPHWSNELHDLTRYFDSPSKEKRESKQSNLLNPLEEDRIRIAAFLEYFYELRNICGHEGTTSFDILEESWLSDRVTRLSALVSSALTHVCDRYAAHFPSGRNLNHQVVLEFALQDYHRLLQVLKSNTKKTISPPALIGLL